MVSKLLELPVVFSALIFILGVVALSLAVYAIARRVLGGMEESETRDLAGSVLFRVAALHALVLGLVFAQELASIRDVHVASAHEASLVSDIYHDLLRYDPESTRPIQADLALYADRVIHEEWPMLADEKRLALSAWQAWEAAYDKLLDLEPDTPRQERLLRFLLDDIRELSELRDARENAAIAGVSHLFLFAAITGVTLIAAAYFTWPATVLNLTLIGAFTAFTGLIIYFVTAYANPYHAPGNADPIGFERFLNENVRALLDEPK